MANTGDLFLQKSGKPFRSYVGMETDLIFNKGIDLPHFAAYPFVESDSGRKILKEYFTAMIDLAKKYQLGLMLESPTWMANRDRGEPLGHTAEQIMSANRLAIQLLSECIKSASNVDVVISANVGPRGDAYAPNDQMTIEEAAAYHDEQISVLSNEEVDVISAFTLCYA